MLDVHALLVTPGAGVVLGADGAVAAGGDGCSSPGVPIGGGAVLKMWGFNSTTADSIANIRLRSQDMVDPVDGITYTPGTTAIQVQHFDYTTLQYIKGTRSLNVGTNTGVVAGVGFLIDQYSGGAGCVQGKSDIGGEVMVGPTTFGGALTADTWGTQPFVAGNLPAGKYAILGCYVSAITNVALIRFSHNSFKGFKPGFPVANANLATATTVDIAMKDPLVQDRVGGQFIYLSEELGVPCCPVFEATNAGTGLAIEINDVIADTPIVNLCIARVG
jgi:hypothetical protein